MYINLSNIYVCMYVYIFIYIYFFKYIHCPEVAFKL